MKQILQMMAIATLVGQLMLSDLALAKQDQQESGLKEFINLTLRVNPAVAEAEARVAAAAAGQKAASRWRHNPELEYELEDVEGEEKTKLLGLTQTIDWSGKFLSSGRTADFELKAVEAERDAVRLDVTVDVLAGLADYRASSHIFRLATQRSSLMERFAGLAAKSFKAGDIDQSEYNLAQLAFSEALIEQAYSETALSQSRQALDFAIGFPPDNSFSLPDLPETLPEIPVSNLSEDDVLTRLPAIRGMKYHEEAAKALITQARKDRLPDPTIGVVGGKDAGVDMIGFTFSVPLHVFNTFGAEVDQARQEAIADAKARQKAFYSAKTQLKAARLTYQLSKKAWQNWQDKGAQALAEQVDILNRKFKVGDLSATDYLVQIEQALDTEVASEELHNKAWQSWFAWLAASGSVEQWIKNIGEAQ